MRVLDYGPLIDRLETADIGELAASIPQLLKTGLDSHRYGDIPRWQEALDNLPEIDISSVDLNSPFVRVGTSNDGSSSDHKKLHQSLQGLHPWRKGPFDICGIHIDTEWRSDIKWDRLIAGIHPLIGRKVLDVGCGSGYHCWRMAGMDAELVVGIDPTPLFVMQFWALQKYINDLSVWVLPLRLEEMPAKLATFETVFSMGVLYHRRSPFDHLKELRETMVEGGQLVLETLVIEGGEGEVLVPEGRYSKMGNIWFLPSVPTLCSWLKKMKFRDIEVIDVSVTTKAEQRSTDWMQFQSLEDFLDPADMTKTIEGHPAPRRAIVIATA